MNPERMASLARDVTRDADEFKKLIKVREILDAVPTLKEEAAIRHHDVRIDAKVLLANLDVGALEMAIVTTIKIMWPEIMERLEVRLQEEINRIENRWKEVI